MALKVTAAILVQDGKIFIAKKGPQDKRANQWEFPGGKIDPGETPEVCLAREMMEEFGITVRVGAFFTESLYAYPEGEILVMAYYCTWTGGALHLTEHAEYRWVGAAELTHFNFVPSDRPIAEKLAREFQSDDDD